MRLDVDEWSGVGLWLKIWPLEKKGYGFKSSGWKADIEPHIGHKTIIHDRFI